MSAIFARRLFLYKTKLLILIGLTAVGFAPSLIAKGDIELGRQKSATCVACHNQDGNATTPAWPKIAGQHPGYLIKQLQEMRKGEKGKRHNPMMYSMIEKLTDQDIQDLAAYFASQKQSLGEASQSLAVKGERIYKGGIKSTGVPACTACHGPEGLGNNPANFPRLSGQHAEYTIIQMDNFKSGARANDPNEIMRDISAKMTEEEIKAVSSYVAGLH
jgi:cytochrome c553